MLVPLSGGARRTLTAPPRGASDIAPAFSPDGRRLAFQRIPTTAVSDIWVAEASGANAKRITFDNRLLEGPTWTEDGQSLIFSSARLGAGRLWRVAAAGGTPEALPDTGPGSTMPTVPRRGDRLAFVASLEDTNMWEVPIGPGGAAAGPPRLGVSASSWLDGSPDFSGDGKQLVFVSNRTGRDEIFIGSADSVTARQITDFSRVPASTVGSPRISPDGADVVFDARVRGNADVYIVSTAGGAPRALTTDAGADVVPVWSPDGASIYFTSRRGGPPQIWRMRRNGGGGAQVTTGGAFGAQFSFDGRFLVYRRERVNTSLGGGRSRVDRRTPCSSTTRDNRGPSCSLRAGCAAQRHPLSPSARRRVLRSGCSFPAAVLRRGLEADRDSGDAVGFSCARRGRTGRFT